MKWTRVFSITSILMLLFLQIGCGGDDSPADPPSEDCSISVTGPLAGALYQVGEHVNINWDETGDASEVVIQLLKGEHVAGTIGTVNNDGYQGWSASTMGAASGGEFAIRVSAQGETGCSDDSAPFSIIDTEGCELAFTMADTAFLDAGMSYDITWQSSNTTGQVEIRLMWFDRLVGYVASDTEDDGHFSWTVDSFHDGSEDDYYFLISDPDVDGCTATSSTFRINDPDICEIWVQNPQPGVVWANGETRDISFTALDENTTHLNISLYQFQGHQLVAIIASMVPVQETGQEQTYSWLVDASAGSDQSTDYRIKITDANDQNCEAWSEDFTIPQEP